MERTEGCSARERMKCTWKGHSITPRRSFSQSQASIHHLVQATSKSYLPLWKQGWLARLDYIVWKRELTVPWSDTDSQATPETGVHFVLWCPISALCTGNQNYAGTHQCSEVAEEETADSNQGQRFRPLRC